MPYPTPTGRGSFCIPRGGSLIALLARPLLDMSTISHPYSRISSLSKGPCSIIQFHLDPCTLGICTPSSPSRCRVPPRNLNSPRALHSSPGVLYFIVDSVIP